MKVDQIARTACWFGVCAGLALAVNAQAQTNSWTDGTGKWENGANWSAGAPSSSHAAILITNSTTKVVTIDATTALSNVVNGCMTISNLVVSRSVPPENTLQITNVGGATPLRILNSLTIASGGTLVVTNSTLQVDPSVVPCTNVLDGLATVAAGGVVVIATNSTTFIGSATSATGT